jgi:hypothetical protein
VIRAPWTITAAPAWVPNDGPLVITLVNYQGVQIPIGSIYLPKADVPIACSASPTPGGGNPFYTVSPSGNNPQTIPVPSGTMQVTLTASSAETYYVFAASGIFRPLMEGASTV